MEDKGPPRLPPRPPGTKKALWSTAGPAAAATLAAYWAWVIKSSNKPPRLWAGVGELKSQVLPLCSLLHKPYAPAPLALNTHLQNILGYVRGRAMDAKYTRQLVIAHDGGTLGLDWYQGCDAAEFGPSTQPVLLVLHGINGGSHEGYCKWVCHCATQRGWRGVVLNYRGCAGLPLTSPRGYAATLTHDVHYAITSIKARFPHAPLFAAGYSLGGVFLTKYLAESDAGLHASLAAASSGFEPFQGSGLVAAAVVSSPICLFNSSANLSVPWTSGYLYNLAVAFKLKEFMTHHRATIRSNPLLDLDKALNNMTMAAIEDAGIPNTFGFSNRQEYYEQASSLAYIPLIQTPTLFLVSQDDPFLGVLPDQECSANPNTVLAATARGGHVAFLQGWWPFGPAYMDATVLQFMDNTWKHLPRRAVRHESVGGMHAHDSATVPTQLYNQGGMGMGMSDGVRRVWLETVSVVSGWKPSRVDVGTSGCGQQEQVQAPQSTTEPQDQPGQQQDGVGGEHSAAQGVQYGAASSDHPSGVSGGLSTAQGKQHVTADREQQQCTWQGAAGSISSPQAVGDAHVRGAEPVLLASRL